MTKYLIEARKPFLHHFPTNISLQIQTIVYHFESLEYTGQRIIHGRTNLDLVYWDEKVLKKGTFNMKSVKASE